MARNLKVLLGVILMAMFSIYSFAADNEYKNGFLWYNLPKEEKKTPPQKNIPFETLSYQQRTKVLNYMTLEALHKARFSHDVKDMERFLTLQKYWLNEASVFQHNFQYALLQNPALDPTVKNPVSSIGESLNAERKSTVRQKSIFDLTHRFGLMFFYKGSDPYSQKQASVLKNFAGRYRFEYIPVSVDGVVLETLPNSRIDKGQAKALNINIFPAMILVDPKAGRHLPIAHGFVTQDYLVENIEVIHKQLQSEARGEGVLYE